MTSREHILTSSLGSGAVVIQPNGISSAETTSTDVSSGSARSTKLHSPKSVEAAVYGYTRSVRNLGQTRVNSLDIARALSLPISDVEVALRRLSDKGVRVIA